MKVALIILNYEYSSKDYSNLPGVKRDGDLMTKMLLCYDKVETVEKAIEIEQEVKHFCDKYKNIPIESLHFHYSGHGVDNASVEFDPTSYTNNMEGKVSYHGVTPTGDCMVGSAGDLYSVHDLKHELLKCNPDKLIVTLDCCRNICGRGKTYCVKLRHKDKIMHSDLVKIAAIHGTCELHTARDSDTFTQELSTVLDKEGGEIPILEIASKINKSWQDRGIMQQLCKEDIVKVGDNWSIMWPSCTIKADKENDTGPLPTDPVIQPNQEEMNQRVQKLEDEYRKRMKEMEQKIESLTQNKKRSQTTASRMRPKKAKQTL